MNITGQRSVRQLVASSGLSLLNHLKFLLTLFFAQAVHKPCATLVLYGR
jgi:hypothetical protein